LRDYASREPFSKTTTGGGRDAARDHDGTTFLSVLPTLNAVNSDDWSRARITDRCLLCSVFTIGCYLQQSSVVPLLLCHHLQRGSMYCTLRAHPQRSFSLSLVFSFVGISATVPGGMAALTTGRCAAVPRAVEGAERRNQVGFSISKRLYQEKSIAKELKEMISFPPLRCKMKRRAGNYTSAYTAIPGRVICAVMNSSETGDWGSRPFSSFATLPRTRRWSCQPGRTTSIPDCILSYQLPHSSVGSPTTPCPRETATNHGCFRSLGSPDLAPHASSITL